METIKNMPYKRHVLVCVNERDNGKSCCKHVNGFESFAALKEFVRSNGLVNDIWVTKTGCLGFCNDTGCTIAVYPEKVWFLEAKDGDLEDIKRFISRDLL